MVGCSVIPRPERCLPDLDDDLSSNRSSQARGATARQAPARQSCPQPTALLAWYDRHRRALPWRAPPGQRADPYRVWLSEIMLQQTTVKAVAPYYARFLARWADVGALGGGAARRRAQGLGRARLLRPRPQLARLRACRGRASRRQISGERCRAARAARHRRLHRRRHRRDRLRSAGDPGRRQCRARGRAALRGHDATARRQARDPAARGRPDAAAPRRRFRPSHDGSRRHPLHAEESGLRAMPVERQLRRATRAATRNVCRARRPNAKAPCAAARLSSRCAPTAWCWCGRGRRKGSSAP